MKMKKIISIILCASFALSAASCMNSRSDRDDKDDKKDRHSSEVEDEDEDEDDNEDEDDGGGVSGDFDPDFTFTTTDRSGNTYTEDIFADYELTMINFWEPWCGPCVGEMPDLQALYSEYGPEGFLILGVYSEEEMEEDVNEVLSSTGVKYPILRYTSEFDQFQSGYVPTTVFVDRNGHILTVPDGTDMIVGSNSYDDWNEIISDFLSE